MDELVYNYNVVKAGQNDEGLMFLIEVQELQDCLIVFNKVDCQVKSEGFVFDYELRVLSSKDSNIEIQDEQLARLGDAIGADLFGYLLDETANNRQWNLTRVRQITLEG